MSRKSTGPWSRRRFPFFPTRPSASGIPSPPAGGVASGPLRGAGSEELGDNAGFRGVPPGAGEDDDLPGCATAVCAGQGAVGSHERAESTISRCDQDGTGVSTGSEDGSGEVPAGSHVGVPSSPDRPRPRDPVPFTPSRPPASMRRSRRGRSRNSGSDCEAS